MFKANASHILPSKPNCPSKVKKQIFPQLDGLRAIAALAVVVHHFWPGSVRWDLSGGRLAVDFFFVLSGYLITRTLLRSRLQTPRDPLAILKRFHLRRIVRIFPVYYLTLAIACLIPSERTVSMMWHAVFLSNVYFILRGHYVGADGHLWALAVEQHFYLLWPLVVLWVPRSRVFAAAWGMIALGILTHWIAGIVGWSDLVIDVSTPSAFGALGVGACLTCWMEGREAVPDRFGMWISAVGLAGACFWGIDLMGGHWCRLLFTEFSRSLLLVWIVAQAVWGIPGWIGTFLESFPARELGRWSYAIYLSHNFIFAMFKARPHHVFGLSMYDSQAVLALAVTLAWSAACYYLLEKPIANYPK